MAAKKTEMPVVSDEEVVKPIKLAEAAGVRPQMVYNYIRTGRLKAFQGQIEGETRTQLLVPADVAEEWLTKYLDRKAEREEAATKGQEEVEQPTEA